MASLTRDVATLATCMDVLGNPVRLELLRTLRVPHSLADIRIRPHRHHDGLSPDRSLARQTVKEHLDRLGHLGLIQTRAVTQGGRETSVYQIDHARVFAVVEELRELSTLRPLDPAADGATLGWDGTLPPAAPNGPRLVLVHGVHEGRSFALPVAGECTIGRAQGADVCLDYDPYVSRQHATIVGRDGQHQLVDDGPRNAVTVNWEPLADGGTQTLRPGDILGVGRSRLVYAPGP